MSMRLRRRRTWSSAASWSTSKKPACTPATVRACCRRSLAADNCRHDSRLHVRLALALKVVGLMNVQYAIQRRHGLRARSESPGLAHRAVCQQGDRRAAGENCGAIDGRQEAADMKLPLVKKTACSKSPFTISSREIAGVSVQQIPRRGYHPGSGDALHRRSDGRVNFFGEAFAKAQLGAGQRLPRRARSSSA